MPKQFVVTVMGDLNVELTSELSENTFPDIQQDLLVYRPISTAIGGTAANFALAALGHFREVYIIGKVGADILGTTITDHLTKAGIHPHCNIDPNAPTGLSIYIRDATRTQHRGVRLLMIQAHSANYALDTKDVKLSAKILAQSDLLMLDGYCFLEQPRRDASLQAMHIAHSNDVSIAFDIVPHTAYELYDFDTLKSRIKLVNILIVEVGTIRRFLGLEVSDGIIEKRLALETAAILRSKFKEKTFFLRYGIGGIDESLLCLPGMEPRHSFTGYRITNDPRGFGDKLAARELAELLSKLA